MAKERRRGRISVAALAVPALLSLWACSDPQGLDECEMRELQAHLTSTDSESYGWPEIVDHAPPDSVVTAVAKGDQSEIVSLVQELDGKVNYVFHTISWVSFDLEVGQLEQVASAEFVWEFAVAHPLRAALFDCRTI